jgi:hypothetical protein
MGWTSCERWVTKQDVIADFLRSDYYGKTIAHHVGGKGLWRVLESTKGEDGTFRRFIAFDLLEKHGGEWSYKDMDESMHPYYYDCPIRFLDMAPVTSQEWRDKVYQYHADKRNKARKARTMAAKVAIGDYYELPGYRTNGPVKVVRIEDGKVWAISGNYSLYRLKPRHLAVAVKLPALEMGVTANA